MRCPVCKADNLQGPQCRRCKADLSLLFALEEQRQRRLAEARRWLIRGEWQEAARHAEAANWLRCDEDSLQSTAVTHLMNRNFAGAWLCYQNWQTSQRGDASGPT